MRRHFLIALAASLALPLHAAPVAAQTAQQSQGRWTAERANAWYAKQPWIVGANFAPSTAINQLEMFQTATWDPETIDRELGWAQSIGMNTVRVYLHDLLWQQDPKGFTRKVDQLLAMSEKRGIKPILVLFDSVWDPDPQLGPQRAPMPGIHNSGWVQSPSRRDLVDRGEHARLLGFVRGIVGAFARDDRVLMWDIWNEPDNNGGGSYNPLGLADEHRMIAELLPRAFAEARRAGATQPLTSGVWIGDDWSPTSTTLNEIQRIQLAESDVMTFHDYNWPETFERRVAQMKQYGRPVICTEWMARGNGSNVETILPIAKRENVGMVNWGLVDGDSQTRFPWDSWEHPYVVREPAIWFHDLFKADGTPYRQRELDMFRQLTGRGTPAPAAAAQ